jgi:hypothetical protein
MTAAFIQHSLVCKDDLLFGYLETLFQLHRLHSCVMRSEDDHERCVSKGLKGGGFDLLKGNC